MVAILLDAVQILAALTSAGVNIDKVVTDLHASGHHAHAATLENLKAAGDPDAAAQAAGLLGHGRT